ncbi:tail fiber protein [Salmonella enterica]|nr:tail fiber protein [Salmonella enterica]
MANLPETPQWEDGIYQIEVSDPVLGGPDGISNRQAKQLAKRTSYLKQQVENGSKDLADHIAAPNPHTQYAPKESPALTGTPTAPTAIKTDNSTKLATTGYVKNVVADYAPLASPGLTGKPTAPTAAQASNDTQLATTAFVKAALAALVASSPEALDTLNELAAALGNDPNFATTMTNALAGKQPLDNTLTALSGKSVSALLEYLRIVDATTSQKGLVRLNGGVTDESNKEAATPGAVKIAYDAAMNAFDLAKTKYTAEGATTGKAGLVQLVSGMGGSSALVMPQVEVTTAIQTYPSLGKGQTLQDLRGSRGVGVTYTNSTGFPIAVYVRITGSTSANLYAYIDGKEFGGGGATASQTALATAFFIVPNGLNYRVDASGNSTVLQAWTELK